LLAALRQWAASPVELRTALAAARRVEETLAVEAQILLVDYLQHLLWREGHSEALGALEALRGQLLAYVSPRLAWEVALGRLAIPGTPIP
jgi:DNA polymerase-3 subunit delta'